MQTSGNTILITRGGTGIGRGLAEAFHKEGNQVIISGRRQAVLDETMHADAGMRGFRLDVEDPPEGGEILVEGVKALRYAEREGTYEQRFDDVNSMQW